MKTNHTDRKRLAIIAIFLLSLYVLLIVQFYRIQIIQGNKWTQYALAQHQTTLKESFRRGSFYSNTSIKKGHPEEDQPLVLDVMKFHLFIDPESIPQKYKAEAAKKILQFLNVENEYKQKVTKEFYRKSRSRKISTWLEKSTKEQIQSWWKDYAKKNKIPSNAIFFQKDYQRSYPFKTLLGQILQTVQEEKDPLTMQAIPIGGLELSFNKYLKGKTGKRQILRSPLNPIDGGKIIDPPVDGADIYLTINHYLQAIAEAELKKGVIKAEAKGGWAIMLDPKNGHILALAQYPFFNPEKYKDYFNDPEMTEHVKIKAACDVFEPGSIFKMITASIAFMANEELEKKGEDPLFSPDEKIRTTNGFFPGRVRPLKDGRLHKVLNLDMAMQKSSNIYFGELVKRITDRLGDNWYREKLLQFGFGRKTDVQIPSESLGLVPTPGKMHPNGKLEWSKPTPYSIAIGHNILVTSLQMARAAAVIANGGYLIEPTICRKIVQGEKVLYDHQKSKKIIYKIMSKKSTDRILKSLRCVTKYRGTSPLADLDGYSQGGKSGTSEKVIDGKYSKSQNISSFLGFAPSYNPRFVLLISIDEPMVKWVKGAGKNTLGGVCAAPIFKEVAQKALAYLGVEPDDLENESNAESKRLVNLYNDWNQ